MREIKGKKGVSAVVATVLLIFISIVAIGLIAAFVVPMIRENLEEGGSCFDARDQVEIDVNSDYTFYDATKTSLKINRGMKEIAIKGFVVAISSGETTETYQVLNNTVVAGVNGDEIIRIPNPGGGKTYVFGIGDGKKADVALMLKNGNICNPISYNIPRAAA